MPGKETLERTKLTLEVLLLLLLLPLLLYTLAHDHKQATLLAFASR